MSKLVLTKDPSHKGYYTDADGNLYVFRFGGRPIKVDDYREDKPNEDFSNKKVEVEKEAVVDGTEKAQKEYKIGGTEGDVHEYAEKQGISYDQAETLLNINGDDYVEGPKNDERIFNDISKFYGYDKMTDDELRRTLDFAEERKLYHSQSDIDAMRRVLDSRKTSYSDMVKESDKAVDNYQKLAKEYEKAADKYFATDYNSSDYEKLRDAKNEASEKMNAAKAEAIQKFNNTIPYKELFKVGSEVAGVKTNFSEPTVDDRGYVKYTSDDIRSQCGVFGEVLRDCRLTQFNSTITFDEKTHEPYYWGSMDLQYQHNDGGSNGMKVMDYTYSKKNGWEMTDTKGNIYHNGKKLMTASEIADYYVRHGYSQETAMELANKRISERKTN